MFRKGRIGARVQKGAYWCSCSERGVLVLVFRKGHIGARVQKGAYWCSCSERGVLVLVFRKGVLVLLFRKGRIGARVQKGAYWCSCSERGVLVLVFRKGRIGARVQKGAYWCSFSERGVLVLVFRKGRIGDCAKKYPNCENGQHIGPKQDTGENVAISRAPIIKLKNNGTRRGSKNSESESDVREAWKCEDCEKIFKSEKDRMLECEYCGNRYCIKCLKLKPGEYEAMGKPGCMWFCLKCKPKI